MSKKSREKKQGARIKARAEKRRQSRAELEQMRALLQKPTFADIEAPEGFRPITITQALLEFIEPLKESVNSAELDDMNQIMNLGIQIWNFANPKVAEKPAQEEIIDQIAETLELDEIDAAHLFERMVARKTYLFPEGIQPEDPRTLFMRKEVSYRIAQFDASQLHLSEKPIPPDQDDQQLVADLCRLDQALADGEDYDAWEDLYGSVEEFCCDRYYEWLAAKGVPDEHVQLLPFCVQTYLDFVYRYSASGLNKVSAFDLEEFFLDHLLRKIAIQPNDYVYWPPALRAFYTFLTEKGYLENP
jgi:hypothetical protein